MQAADHASPHEAEALRFATEYLSKQPLRPEDNIKVVEELSVAVADTLFDLYMSHLPKPDGAAWIKEHIAPLIEHADRSYSLDQVIWQVIARFNQNGVPLPRALVEYSRRQPLPRPVKKTRGPDPRNQRQRNLSIISCVGKIASLV